MSTGEKDACSRGAVGQATVKFLRAQPGGAPPA